MSTRDATPVGKTGIFGGSFDPVHLGHLILAADLLETGLIDQLLFVPAACSPLKANAAVAGPEHRLRMLELAIQGIPGTAIWDGELGRAGPSYSVDTAEALRNELPGKRLYWILGADQMEQLSAWHNIEKLAGLVEFIAMRRPGHTIQPPSSLPRERFTLADNRKLDIRSSEIRARLGVGKSVELFLPAAVNHYIHSNHLYGPLIHAN